MSNKEQNIGFKLIGIKTEQFATIDKNFQDEKEVNLAHQLRFAANSAHRTISARSDFNFEVDKQPFLVIGVSGHFQVSEETFNSFVVDSGKAMLIPKGFMAHLTMLTVGTTRGVLHAKTENTKYNKYLLPTVNVAAIIRDDVHIVLIEKEVE